MNLLIYAARLLLLPVTAFIWYLIVYWAFIGLVNSLILAYSLNTFLFWVLMLAFYPFVFGLIGFVTEAVPMLLGMAMFKLYGHKPWFILIITSVHTIAGVLGIVTFIFSLYTDPSSMTALFSNMLESWIRTLFLALPYFGMMFSTAFALLGIPWAVYAETKENAENTIL